MPLVSSCAMLKNAQATGRAIGAFNIENMEMAQAVIDAAVEANLPIILQTTPSTVRYASPAVFAGMVSALAKVAPIEIAMHLDHGSSFELAMEAIEGGYSSVMFDGSQLSFDENVRLTKKVVDAAGNIPVEAELGSVGGKEDDHEAENAYTDPADAQKFVELTGVKSLAIAIGTAHGVYSGEPVLDIARLAEIRKRVSIPLVLHGGSGLSDDDFKTFLYNKEYLHSFVFGTTGNLYFMSKSFSIKCLNEKNIKVLLKNHKKIQRIYAVKYIEEHHNGELNRLLRSPKIEKDKANAYVLHMTFLDICRAYEFNYYPTKKVKL